MSPRDAFEAEVATALAEQAESAQQMSDTTVQLARLQRAMSRDRSRLRIGVSVMAAAAAIAVIAGAVAVGPYVGRGNNSGHHNATRFPKLQGIVAAAPLPASALTSSGPLDATAAPELVTAGALWSVQNAGNEAFVLRSDPTTLRTISTVRFSAAFGHWQVSQLLRVGDVVVMPVAGWQPAGSGGGERSAAGAAILRFDAGTGRMLTPLLVGATGFDVATPMGVFVQVDVNRVGLLDPTGSRIVRQISMPLDGAVAYASGLLWGFDVQTRKLVGVDPSSGRIPHTFSLPEAAEAELLPGGPDALLVVPRNITSVQDTGTYRFDTRRLRLTAGTEYGGGGFSNGPTAWAIDGNRLWTAYGALLVEFDATTLRMLHAYAVTQTGLNDTGINAAVPVAGGRMYVSDSNTNEVHSFDLTRLR